MMLQVKHLSFSYGGVPALRDVSFDVAPGTVLCVMGPNGSGKSTLLDTVLGLHVPDTGTILLNGQNLSGMDRKTIARHVAYVPQNHSVAFPYTVREAVLMGRSAYLSPFGSPTRDDHIRCEQAMKQAGIEALADRPYNTISGGDLRLVLLARALCQDAPLILMDEPTAHLDYRNELILLDTVCTLSREHGITMVIATHAPQQAFYLEGKHIDIQTMFLKKGSVAAFGTPESCITTELIREVYGIESKILDSEGEKTVLLRHPL